MMPDPNSKKKQFFFFFYNARGFIGGGVQAQWLVSRTMDQGMPGSRPGQVAVRCGLE